jgi:hypothetical protein
MVLEERWCEGRASAVLAIFICAGCEGREEVVQPCDATDGVVGDYSC